MEEKGVGPLRATLFALLSAGALAAGTLLGLRVGHPFLGGLAGYIGQLALGMRAFHTPVAS